MSQIFSNEQLDREIRNALAIDAANVSGAPDALTMAQRIGSRHVVDARLSRLALVAAVVALLAAIALSAAYVGSQLVFRNQFDVVPAPSATYVTASTLETAAPSPAPVSEGAYEPIFLRPQGPGLGPDVDVVQVDAAGRQHIVATLAGSVGSQLLSRSVVSESGLLARPILLSGGELAYELSDLTAPQSPPFDVTGINQGVDIQGGSAYGSLPPAAVWYPGDVLEIPWFVGSHPTNWTVTRVDARSRAVTVGPDALPASVCEKTTADGSRLTTDANGVSIVRATGDRTPILFEDNVDYACFAPDDLTIAYSAPSGDGIIQAGTWRVTPVDGTFAGWTTPLHGP